MELHISFTKGEGFGRPLLEATASEKIVIAPNWSGQIDFLDSNLSILLPGKLEQVHQSAVWDKVVIKESGWFTINYDYAAKSMKDVYKNTKNYDGRAKSQAKRSRNVFSMNEMDRIFDVLMEKYVPKFATEKPLVLPEFSNGPVQGLKKRVPLKRLGKPTKLKKIGETVNV